MDHEKIRVTTYTALNANLFFLKLSAKQFLYELNAEGSTSVVARVNGKLKMREKTISRLKALAKNDPQILYSVHGCDKCSLPGIYSSGQLPDLKVISTQGDRFITQAEHCPAILGILRLWKDSNLITGKFAMEMLGTAPCLKKRRRDVEVIVK